MIILGLGTNIGDRLAYLEAAIRHLSEVVLNITAVSTIYESAALLKPGAPEDWNISFLNMAIMGETHLSPQALLTQIKYVEKRVGRQDRGEWAPREIDIDILAYDSLHIDESDLKIPHAYLCEREFALLPFAEIAPNWRYPVKGIFEGKSAYEIAKSFLANRSTCKTDYKLNLQNNTKSPKLVGILNITPDSFSDGGLAGDAGAIISAAQKLIDDDADVIDIGAESTRPGAVPLTHEEEWRRLAVILPQICKLAKKSGILTSIDTRHAATVAEAIACGIDWVNDVSGASDTEMLQILAAWKGRVVIMHNLGVPADKNITIPTDKNPIDDVLKWLEKRLDLLEKNGIARERIIIDPGIGFGKNAEQSWAIINNIAAFKNLGAEVLVGHSRKSFLSSLSRCLGPPSLWEMGSNRLPPNATIAPHPEGEGITERDAATLAVSKQLAAQGVDYLRVHNVGLHKMELLSPVIKF